MGDERDHWDGVYGDKAPDAVSWYAPRLERSLRWITEAVGPDGVVVDVGAGASTLVDDLLAAGYRDVTALDLSERALARSRARLGGRADQVTWRAADVTTARFDADSFDLWHDRAVFHFLVDSSARARYVAQVEHAVRPGGTVIIATFGLDGPERCSGLPVARYDADGLLAVFGRRFELEESATEVHTTPWGAEQRFCACRLRLR